MPTNRRTLYRRWRRRFARFMEGLSLSRQQRFYLIAVIIGILSGLCAVLFHETIVLAEKNLIHRMALLPGWLGIAGLILMPAAGGLVVGFLLKHWAPEASGSGIPQTKAAYYLRFGRIRFRTAVAKFMLSSLSIGSGGSLGREGPTVQLCSAIASWVGRWFGLANRQVMALIPLGCAGGIAAAFNTPMAAIVFAIEEIMGDLNHKAVAGIVMVAVLAAVIERSLLGPNSMFQVPTHPEVITWPPFFWSLVLGILAGFFSEGFVRLLLSLRAQSRRFSTKSWAWMVPGLGGLVTGCIGAAVFFYTGRMGVFGIGYHDLSEALFGNLGLSLLAVLFVAKFAATIFSYASGGAGGIFAPTLFIGAMLGGIIGFAADFVGMASPSMPSILAVVGMGAMFAGIIRAPVTSILIIFELTRDYNLILPIMLANLSAYAIATKLRQVPIYEALLLQDGINLRKFPILRPSRGWQSLPASTIMTNTVHTLTEDQALEDAYTKIKDERFKIYPVVDANHRYVGLVHRKGITVVRQSDPTKRVRDIFISDTFPKVYPDTKIRKVAEVFVNTEWVAVPVVSRLDEDRIIGILTLHDITRQQFLQENEGD